MSAYKNARILVAGGAGFIGYHLCKYLLRRGDTIICLDDLSSGQWQNVRFLSVFPRFEFVFHDVAEPVDLRVDQIFNLACPASPPAYQRDPIKTLHTNVEGTRRLLELARANKARVVQASTSEVYGDPEVHPQREDYCGRVNSMGPRACYDEGKRCAETLMYDYRRIHGVDTRVARIFNTYGPHMREDDGRVVSNFVMEALQNLDITIYGDGTHTRSLCYIDDMVRGLVCLMDGDIDTCGPFNLGNPCELSILDLAHLVMKMTGTKSQITHLPDVVDDPHIRCPDIARAKAVLNWEPHVELQEGLQATIDYFSGRLVEGKRRPNIERMTPRHVANGRASSVHTNAYTSP